MIRNFQAYELATRLYRISQKLSVRGPMKNQLERAAAFDLLEIKDAEALELADRIAACVYRLTYRKPK